MAMAERNNSKRCSMWALSVFMIGELEEQRPGMDRLEADLLLGEMLTGVIRRYRSSGMDIDEFAAKALEGVDDKPEKIKVDLFKLFLTFGELWA